MSVRCRSGGLLGVPPAPPSGCLRNVSRHARLYQFYCLGLWLAHPARAAEYVTVPQACRASGGRRARRRSVFHQACHLSRWQSCPSLRCKAVDRGGTPAWTFQAVPGGSSGPGVRLSTLCLLCAGTSVFQVTAHDADDPTYGNSAKIVYSILDGKPYFSVDPKSGQTHVNPHKPAVIEVILYLN